MWRLALVSVLTVACGDPDPATTPDGALPDANVDAPAEPSTLLVDPVINYAEQAPGPSPRLQHVRRVGARGPGFIAELAVWNETDAVFEFRVVSLDRDGLVANVLSDLGTDQVASGFACNGDGACAYIRLGSAYELERISATGEVETTSFPELRSGEYVGAYATGFVAVAQSTVFRYASAGAPVGASISLTAELGLESQQLRAFEPGCTSDGCWIAQTPTSLVFVSDSGAVSTVAMDSSFAVDRIECTEAACFAFDGNRVSRRIGTGAFEPPVELPFDMFLDSDVDGSNAIAWLAVADGTHDISVVALPSAGPLTPSTVAIADDTSGGTGACNAGRCLAMFARPEPGTIGGVAYRVRLDFLTVLDTTPVPLFPTTNTQDLARVACDGTGCLVSWRDQRLTGTTGRTARYIPDVGWESPTSAALPFVADQIEWTGTRYVAFESYGERSATIDATGAVTAANWLPSLSERRSLACGDICALVWVNYEGVHLRRLTLDGEPLGDVVVHPTPSNTFYAHFVSVVRRGDDFVALWAEDVDAFPDRYALVRARPFTSDGTLGTTTDLANIGNIAKITAAAAGDHVIVGFANDRAGYFSFDADLVATPVVPVAAETLDLGAASALGNTVALTLGTQVFHLSATGELLATHDDVPSGDLAANGIDAAFHVTSERDEVLGVDRLALRPFRLVP